MLPALEGKSSVIRHILGDWELTGITGAATGQPFSAYLGSIQGLPAVLRAPGTLTVNGRTAPVSRAAGGGPDEQIINPDAYTLNGFQLGTNGTARRGDCTGPGYFQTDLGFYKTFPLGGRARFQFRWDIFNIFNNTNFLFAGMDATMSPSAVVLSPDGTRIDNATIPGNFGQATRTRDPRQMQIGFKILW